MSKGSKPRPVDKDKFDREFDRIFGKKPHLLDVMLGEDGAVDTERPQPVSTRTLPDGGFEEVFEDGTIWVTYRG